MKTNTVDPDIEFLLRNEGKDYGILFPDKDDYIAFMENPTYNNLAPYIEDCRAIMCPESKHCEPSHENDLFWDTVNKMFTPEQFKERYYRIDV